MELVYLWVEDYKNIHHQGFNFSPKFECKFHDEYDEKGNLLPNCKLEINPKEHIENFFGENINITAIVGKNGSGKSSLLMQKLHSLKNMKVVFNNNILYIANGNYDDTLTIINHTNYSLISNNKENKISFNQINFDWDILKPVFMDWYKWTYYHDSNILLSLLTNEETFDLYYFYRKLLQKIIQIGDNFPFDTSIFKPSLILIENIKDGEKQEEFIKKFGENKIWYYLLEEKGNLINFENFINTYDKNYIAQLIDEQLLHIQLLNKNKVNLFDLSHGELSIFISIFLIFEEAIKKDQNSLIYLDEPELTLHPQWQKEYINQLIEVFSFFDKKVHFILTSHSPFIISDLPKENIIFLENGKQIQGLKDKKQTFGANIHTLLSDSFFMEDGLMGEFAKSKINEIIDFHKEVEEENEKKKKKKEYDFTPFKTKYKENKTKFWQTQSIIGEDYLKQVIKNHLRDIETILLGHDEAKQEEIKRVEAYLESLKK